MPEPSFATTSDTSQMPNETPVSPNHTPKWHKCLSCADYGDVCNGPSLNSLGNIDSVRAFHKALRTARKIQLKEIIKAAPSISESTINEYFSHIAKDYKWTTVSAIDNAMICVCGKNVGVMPVGNTCPASSSEIRNMIAAAELKVAAAELKVAQSENDVAGLMQRIASNKEKHIAQIAQMESSHAKDMQWHRNEIKLWRRFAFVLLAVSLILLSCLLLYVGWDAAHPATGIIRY